MAGKKPALRLHGQYSHQKSPGISQPHSTSHNAGQGKRLPEGTGISGGHL